MAIKEVELPLASHKGIFLEMERKIINKIARIGVIGLGYVGLPLAVEFAGAGYRTLGFDLNRDKVERINRGESYIPDVPWERVQELRQADRLAATTDFKLLDKMDVVFICVPTPFNRAKDPDLSYIEAAANQIAAHLHPGMMIVLESTTYPGTTEEVVLPRLEATGLKAGEDFFLVFSPERVDPGNKKFTTHNTPKVIGGLTPACMELARLLYSQIIENNAVHLVSSPAVAEMTKLLENTFRAVNIALVNEMALLCHRMGIDIWEVIDAAATKPFGYMPFYPGPGVGGHCIPVDPYYLLWKAREYDFHTRFIELAAEVNNSMPVYVVERIAAVLNEREKPLRGAKILALGATFKKDIDDCRYSPAIHVMELLIERGVALAYHDPYVPALTLGNEFRWGAREKEGVRLESVDLTEAVLGQADCVVILVDHSCFDWEWIVSRSPLVFDTRNATKGIKADNVIKL
ncbi:UDP-N-acetyl-D-mannosamine/glucosamine dehydrogenase [Moorella glycerini]|uniref:UDP-N-acetyl-D-glucosamine 6-dehydrogenase n=1 Tax=Neomoorella stamsii TaxID=1266720 RepID=A0A9X7P6L4_9FIRM|nr:MULTISPECIES: nucleotide sugar dehydrogenase [Moorella]PRR73804.1 UDP-N-acetyl-D-glucosamine 6-dehydrogenase [Moorella stamsii]CEP67178.1 UDP-N-acetyl-D-mannosamine/glucosamine dehydrogenase [Moorella glycerini]